ncbi:MAG: cell division protein FtsL [Eggerthellales bacterium]|nr:cell division protein FtsL [Eggerthellales bacterium]
MATAARAYDSFGYERAYQPSRPDVRVRPGRKQQEQPSMGMWVTAAVIAAAMSLVVALFAVAHVWLDSASVSLSVQAQTVSNDLIEVRHAGSLLEVEVSALSNPARIQEAANALGMISPETATIIKLGEDVVVTNAQGDLSLAGSLKVVARNA